MHIAERKRLYEEAHPETKKGTSQASAMNEKLGCGRKVCDDVERFTADTAKKTGTSERKVQMEASRGEKPSRRYINGREGVYQSHQLWIAVTFIFSLSHSSNLLPSLMASTS